MIHLIRSVTFRFSRSIKQQFTKGFKSSQLTATSLTPTKNPGITRMHAHFRVDENAQFASNHKQVRKMVKQQQQTFRQMSEKWKQRTELYYSCLKDKKDMRTKSIVEAYDQWEYFTRAAWEANRQYTTIHRRKIGKNMQEQLVLDIMSYPALRKYANTIQLLKTSISPSHNLIAFAVDLRNNEESCYLIKNLSKNELISFATSNRLPNVHSLHFINDRQFYYIAIEKHRPCRVMFMDLDISNVKELYYEADEGVYLDLKGSKDGKFVIVSANKKEEGEVFLIDLNDKLKLTKVLPNVEGQRVYLDHIDNSFILWKESIKHEIISIPDAPILNALKNSPTVNIRMFSSNAIHILQYDQTIKDIDVFKDKIVLYLQKVTRPILRILWLKSNNTKVQLQQPQLPINIGTIVPGTNLSSEGKQITMFFNSPFLYNEAYTYNCISKKLHCIQKFTLSGNSSFFSPKFSPSSVAVDQVHALVNIQINVPSRTGDYIPLTIIRPKSGKMSKLLLNVYGCYGISTDITYNHAHIAALEMGWTIAYAHVRGGSQKGRKWHQAAKGDNRSRSWKDIQECVAYLIKQKITHPALLFLSSHSAGAITAWNAVNSKPYLYKGLILNNPFLDVLTTLLDPSLPLSVADHQQFGNPTTSITSYRQIQSFSPYQNIQNKEYPMIHIVAGGQDYRCPVNQVLKFVKRFRLKALDNGRFTNQFGEKGVSVRIQQEGSHVGLTSIHDQNYSACQTFAMMDYLIERGSNDLVAR